MKSAAMSFSTKGRREDRERDRFYLHTDSCYEYIAVTVLMDQVACMLLHKERYVFENSRNVFEQTKLSL